MLLIDSSVWIEVLRGSEKGKKAREMIKAQPSFTAGISLAEISYWCYKNNEIPEEALTLVMTGSEGILQTTRKVEKRAGQLRFELNQNLLRREREVGLVDCLIMAIAEESGLGIVTTDKHFLKFSGKTFLV